MSREIKFRAWGENKMHIVGEMFSDQVGGYSYCKTAEEDNRILGWSTLMQFTGLKDKKGKDIYEGDIIGTEDHPHRWVMEWVDDDMEPFGHYYDEPWRDWVVFGNIYENPEMINKK